MVALGQSCSVHRNGWGAWGWRSGRAVKMWDSHSYPVSEQQKSVGEWMWKCCLKCSDGETPVLGVFGDSQYWTRIGIKMLYSTLTEPDISSPCLPPCNHRHHLASPSTLSDPCTYLSIFVQSYFCIFLCYRSIWLHIFSEFCSLPGVIWLLCVWYVCGRVM